MLVELMKGLYNDKWSFVPVTGYWLIHIVNLKLQKL